MIFSRLQITSIFLIFHYHLSNENDELWGLNPQILKDNFELTINTGKMFKYFLFFVFEQFSTKLLSFYCLVGGISLHCILLLRHFNSLNKIILPRLEFLSFWYTFPSYMLISFKWNNALNDRICRACIFRSFYSE